ncbi:MAG: hypothetical protein V4857_23820 [Pseudomonadota bacterium]
MRHLAVDLLACAGPAALLAGALLAPPVLAADVAASAAAAEFGVFYARRFPDQAPPAPRFVSGAAGGAGALSALVDGAAYRALHPLCRAGRSRFTYDPRARAGRRWSGPEAEQLAWIASAPVCAVPLAPVKLVQRLPDPVVIGVLRERAALLQGARLLFGGNSGCAPWRALPYVLAALEVGPAPGGAEEMAVLVFEGAGGAVARVWARPRGAALVAWSVACTAPPR